MLSKWIITLFISTFLKFTCSEGTDSVLTETNIIHQNISYNYSLNDFPDDLFTNYQRKNGAIILHLVAAVYFFTLLALVCVEYYLPSMECICEDLNISKDVAAATFMAFATIAPESLANIISTFVAESDVGIGGVLGSLLFNVLGVSACAGIATSTYLQLEWWPITRDSILYFATLSLLVAFAWDGSITLIESIIMVSSVLVYFIVLIENKRIMHFTTWLMKINLNCCNLNSYDVPASYIQDSVRSAHDWQTEDLRRISNLSEKNKQVHGSITRSSVSDNPIFMIYVTGKEPDCEEKNEKKLLHCPVSHLEMFWWIYTWPIRLILSLTIPDPKTNRRIYPLTFVMSIIWISMNSYLVIWMLSVIGHTFSIPEAITGLIFLAVGNCAPEAISSLTMIMKGENGIGVSNSLGSSSLNILLSLGFPWLIKNLLKLNYSNGHPHVELDRSIFWTACLLLISILSLYLIFALSKYRLQRSVGLVLALVYLILIVASILIEMNMFNSSAF